MSGWWNTTFGKGLHAQAGWRQLSGGNGGPSTQFKMQGG